MHAALTIAALIKLLKAATIDPYKAKPLFKIKLGPGDVHTVTEKEKFELRAISPLSQNNTSYDFPPTFTRRHNVYRYHRPQ